MRSNIGNLNCRGRYVQKSVGRITLSIFNPRRRFIFHLKECETNEVTDSEIICFYFCNEVARITFWIFSPLRRFAFKISTNFPPTLRIKIRNYFCARIFSHGSYVKLEIRFWKYILLHVFSYISIDREFSTNVWRKTRKELKLSNGRNGRKIGTQWSDNASVEFGCISYNVKHKCNLKIVSI